MNKKLSALVLALLLLLASGGMAQATYYHFEDYRPNDVSFTKGTTFDWTFDLDTDSLSLWTITYVPLQNGGEDWSYVPAASDSMGEFDILHRAYLTMRLCRADGDVADLFLDNLQYWNGKDISKGGTGTIDVFTQLYDDHFLKVTISSKSGDFKVDWMNLAGCYETAHATTPEPGTLVLLVMGLVALALLLRRKARIASDNPCR
jgi:hypothetical protein